MIFEENMTLALAIYPANQAIDHLIQTVLGNAASGNVSAFLVKSEQGKLTGSTAGSLGGSL